MISLLKKEEERRCLEMEYDDSNTRTRATFKIATTNICQLLSYSMRVKDLRLKRIITISRTSPDLCQDTSQLKSFIS